MRLLLHTSATKSISRVPSVAAACEATICVSTAGIGITWITSGTFVDICNKKNYRERGGEGGREGDGVGEGEGKGEGEGEGEGARYGEGREGEGRREGGEERGREREREGGREEGRERAL